MRLLAYLNLFDISEGVFSIQARNIRIVRRACWILQVLINNIFSANYFVNIAHDTGRCIIPNGHTSVKSLGLAWGARDPQMFKREVNMYVLAFESTIK